MTTEERIAKAQQIAETIEAVDEDIRTNVWSKGDNVRIYIDNNRKATRYGYVAIAEDGTAETDEVKGCFYAAIRDAVKAMEEVKEEASELILHDQKYVLLNTTENFEFWYCYEQDWMAVFSKGGDLLAEGNDDDNWWGLTSEMEETLEKAENEGLFDGTWEKTHTTGLKGRICGMCEDAEADGKVFVFGDSVYSPQEAREAMLSHAEEDMEMEGLTEDEYIARQKACISDPLEQYVIEMDEQDEESAYDAPEWADVSVFEASGLDAEKAREVAENYFSDNCMERTGSLRVRAIHGGIVWQEPSVSEIARAMGRIGGKAKTEAKAKAARENGAKGGRPRKTREEV